MLGASLKPKPDTLTVVSGDPLSRLLAFAESLASSEGALRARLGTPSGRLAMPYLDQTTGVIDSGVYVRYPGIEAVFHSTGGALSLVELSVSTSDLPLPPPFRVGLSLDTLLGNLGEPSATHNPTDTTEILKFDADGHTVTFLLIDRAVRRVIWDFADLD